MKRKMTQTSSLVPGKYEENVVTSYIGEFFPRFIVRTRDHMICSVNAHPIPSNHWDNHYEGCLGFVEYNSRCCQYYANFLDYYWER